MASLVAKASSGPVSAFSLQDKGSRNKRKFRADLPQNDPTNALPLTHCGSPGYKFSAQKLEITHSHGQVTTCDMCGTSQNHSDASKLNPANPNFVGLSELKSIWPRNEMDDGFHDADWSDFTEAQLEELVRNNLDAIFRSAIKKIVNCGYSEEVATKAILRSRICYGSKDTVSNIVDNTIAYLNNGKEIDPSGDHFFEDLHQLEKYLLVESLGALREVRPFFSYGDALWCLLLCDMNVSLACAIDGDLASSFSKAATSKTSSSACTQLEIKSETKTTEMCLPISGKLAPTVSCAKSQMGVGIFGGSLNVKLQTSLALPSVTSKKEGLSSASISSGKPFNATAALQTSEQKFAYSRKAHATSSKRESILRQNSFHLEKNYRIYGSKGASRAAKLSSLGGLILDRKLRDSAGINLKNASIRMKASEIEVPQDHATLSLSTNSTLSTSLFSTSSSSSFTLDSLKTLPSSSISYVPRAYTATLQPAISTADTELSVSLPTKTNPSVIFSNSEDTNSIYASISSDRSLSQLAPPNKKDEMIIRLIPQVKDLHTRLQGWSEWANQKVMQAARRLSKDKAELKILRQEKEEAEQLKKEKQNLEENTMKKLYEMENALSKASGQVEKANSAVRRLEKENTTLRKEMEDAKIRATESAATCQEVSKREKKTLLKFQSWEKQKSMFEEELAAEKSKLTLLKDELRQAKDLYLQLEARRKQEEKTRQEILEQTDSLRKEREQRSALAKSKEDAIKSRAETNLQKYKEDIGKLEKEISQMRLKTDSYKIAAMKRDIKGSYGSRALADSSPVSKQSQALRFENNFEEYLRTAWVKRERECVMCLSEEMSVVFLPCAHQVVCAMCNDLHQKQGLKDCPSCRSPIQRRICVRFARR